MYIDTEGVILKQVKTVNGRKIVLLFSNKYGKISAGTSISEKGRSKSALAMHPFTHGKYELYKNRDSYNINGAEVIKSYYKIGEDVDKYMACSYVLEFTEKLALENQRAPELFRLLIDFLD
ncbi:MAG: DNA repair protein RecO, partial [Peptostreptococcaceae bacterium]|nr:DNA repair protein RecO [Peptostreptococcaceae bacterium]